MTKKKWVIALFVVSHCTVAALTWFVTWSALRSSSPLPNPAVKGRPGAVATDDGRFATFAEDMKTHGAGSDADVRRDLLLSLQAFEDLPAEDQPVVAGLTPESVETRHLLDVSSVRKFLDSYSRKTTFDVLSFTSRKHRPGIIALFGDADRTPQRAMAERKRLSEANTALLALRKTASELPSTDVDNRLVFLEMMRDLASDNYIDVKQQSHPKFPLFSDSDARTLLALQNWLNTPYAKKAFPADQFGRLYKEGTLQPLSPAFSQYRDAVVGRIGAERTMAEKSGGPSAELATTYVAVDRFFKSLAQIVREP